MIFRDIAFEDVRAAALSDTDTDVAFRMDEEAFRGFYDRTSRMLWVYLRRLTNDPHATDDLLQESYYRFLRASVKLESESHRRHYLFRIATNLARDRFRRSQHRPVHVSHDDAVVADNTPDDAIDRRLDVSSALSRMAQRERAMLWLAYAQGASHQEIAAVVGVKTGSVKPLLYRARRRLAALLGGKDGTR